MKVPKTYSLVKGIRKTNIRLIICSLQSAMTETPIEGMHVINCADMNTFWRWMKKIRVNVVDK